MAMSSAPLKSFKESLNRAYAGIMASEPCRYLEELKEAVNKFESLRLRYESTVADLKIIISAEGDLISCLRLHASSYFDNLDVPTLTASVNLETPGLSGLKGCDEALRALLSLRSRESSLSFMISELHRLLVNEVIRLSGLVALCRHYEPQLAERVYSEVLDRLVAKYLGL
jgi:hypothetical protein